GMNIYQPVVVTALPVDAVAGLPTGDVEVGTVQAAVARSIRRVTIDWGDGTVSDGRLSTHPDGTLGVWGSHTYGKASVYPVRIVAADDFGTYAGARTATVYAWGVSTQRRSDDPDRTERIAA